MAIAVDTDATTDIYLVTYRLGEQETVYVANVAITDGYSEFKDVRKIIAVRRFGSADESQRVRLVTTALKRYSYEVLIGGVFCAMVHDLTYRQVCGIAKANRSAGMSESRYQFVEN